MLLGQLLMEYIKCIIIYIKIKKHVIKLTKSDDY